MQGRGVHERMHVHTSLIEGCREMDGQMREWMGGCLEMAEMEGDGLVDAGQMDTWVDVCICDSEVGG